MEKVKVLGEVLQLSQQSGIIIIIKLTGCGCRYVSRKFKGIHIDIIDG